MVLVLRGVAGLDGVVSRVVRAGSNLVQQDLAYLISSKLEDKESLVVRFLSSPGPLVEKRRRGINNEQKKDTKCSGKGKEG